MTDNENKPAGVPCAHVWFDYGQLGGRNVTWCPHCDTLAWTGKEPDPSATKASAVPEQPSVQPSIPKTGANKIRRFDVTITDLEPKESLLMRISSLMVECGEWKARAEKAEAQLAAIRAGVEDLPVDLATDYASACVADGYARCRKDVLALLEKPE